MAEEIMKAGERALPDTQQTTKRKPSSKQKAKEMPVIGNPENIITIGGETREIKPTKMKYHRNNTAYFYRMIENVSLPDILSYPEDAFGDGRDGDKALMDWLIAVFDDEDFVVAHYDDMDAEIIDRALEIFKRVNKINEREERQKNLSSQVREESRSNEA